ncbi:MAG: alpha-hydroxy-acid oxidizing protein [Bacteroidetes bacterium]|nr:alpha-hydroxy-acid oxidizing protein [Bacteroidota bacterium]MCB0852344.1 alpha-hydroxy-acid oxidizing protein [Bacteroidota bacterium]
MSYQKKAAKWMNQYPGIEDLEQKAEKRMPFVAWEYLQSGTGNEDAVRRNQQKLSEITLLPRFMRGALNIDTSTQLFGRTYGAPFGVAPVGLTGLMWPKIELFLARMAKDYNIPYSLSTVATQIPEDVGALAGDMGWFQLYPPKENDLRSKLLQRASDAGFNTLIITADVPVPSRRERTKRAGLSVPPDITPRLIWQGMMHPTWSIATLRNGLPRLKTVESYSEIKDMKAVGEFVRFKFRGNLSWEYIKEVRDLWKGPIILKGLLHPLDVEEALKAGMDGIGVSNHGGRQFDGAPAAIEMLPEIAKIVNGKAAVIFDSGIRTGLDIIRALALGADFVLMGRPFVYGVSALGQYGGDHTTEIFLDDLKNNMGQLGVETIAQVKNLKAAPVHG